MFEKRLEELIKDRKEINNCDDFDKITNLWTNIKKNYTECKEYIDNINKEINDLIQNEDDNMDQNFMNIKFGESFKEIKEISEKIKSCNLSELSDYLKKIRSLKIACLTILKQEKCKIQEIK